MSERFVSALDDIKHMPVITVGALVDHIEGDALLILSLVSILPFMQPIPIPGLSSILGLIVFFQGIGLLLKGRPLLTQRMKDLVISRDWFDKIYVAAVKFSNFTSKISVFKHPITRSRMSQVLCGLCIIISAGFLSLPLPIPFSNLIPALSIFFICIGLLEEDIMLILCGQAITFTVLWMAMFSFQFIAEKLRLYF